MKTVFRIVGKDGRGVYCGGHARKAGLSSLVKFHQPMPGGGLLHTRFSRPAFAFPTEDSLKKWFSADDRTLLKRVGAKIKVYTVPENHVISTPQQVVFNKRVARLEAELDVVSLKLVYRK